MEFILILPYYRNQVDAANKNGGKQQICNANLDFPRLTNFKKLIVMILL